jgi:hypothetical protein
VNNLIYHGFSDKFGASRGLSEVDDITFLKNNIVDCIDVVKTSIVDEKKGTDYFVYLNGGAKIKVDAKNREVGAKKFWKYGEPELACETWSMVPTDSFIGKIGWTLDSTSQTDLVLYTFDSSDSEYWYLIPFQHLRMAFAKYKGEWTKKYKELPQFSKEGTKRWKSMCVFVPVNTVISAVSEFLVFPASKVHEKTNISTLDIYKENSQRCLLEYVL